MRAFSGRHCGQLHGASSTNWRLTCRNASGPQVTFAKLCVRLELSRIQSFTRRVIGRLRAIKSLKPPAPDEILQGDDREDREADDERPEKADHQECQDDGGQKAE